MPLHIGDPVMGTDGRSRVYYVTTKISWLDRLPNFLSNGAPLARLCAGSATSPFKALNDFANANFIKPENTDARRADLYPVVIYLIFGREEIECQ